MRRLMMFVALLAAIADVGAETPAVSIVAKAPYVMSAETSNANVALPLSVRSGLKPESLRVVVEGVRRDRVVDAALASRFKLSPLIAGAAASAPALRLTVDDVVSLAPGEYDLSLGVLDGNGRRRIDALSLTLERPAAQLEALGKQTLDLVLPHAWAASAVALSPVAIQIPQTPKSKFSGLRAIRVLEMGFRDAAGAALAGQLGASAPDAVAAGAPLRLGLDPSGFSPGTASGRIELYAQGLEAPYRLEVDVRTRLWAVWIPIIVGLGVLCGLLLRVGLQGWVEASQARDRVYEALKGYRRRIEGIHDDALTEALAPSLEALQRAVERADPAAIDARRTEAEAALTSALASFKERFDAAAKGLQELQTALGDDGSMPAMVREALVDARRTADLAELALQRQDATTAQKLVADASQILERKVVAVLVRWQSAFQAQLDEAARLQVFALTASRGRFEDAAKSLRESAARLGAVHDVDAAKQALQGVSRLDASLRELLGWWGDRLAKDTPELAELAASRDISSRAQSSDIVALQETLQAVAARTKALREAEDILHVGVWGDAESRALVEASRLARRLVDEHERNQLINHDQRVTLVARIDAKDWVGAVVDLKVVDTTLAKKTAEPDVRREPFLEGQQAPDQLAAAPPQETAVDMVFPAIDWLSRRNLRELLLAQLLQSSIVAVIVMSASYALFQARFVGTPAELLGLFFWGLSLDVSAGKLLEQAKGLAAKPA